MYNMDIDRPRSLVYRSLVDSSSLIYCHENNGTLSITQYMYYGKRKQPLSLLLAILW